MRSISPISIDELEQLQEELKSASNLAHFKRMQCIWLRNALGLSSTEIAAAVGWHPSSVRRIYSKYSRSGVSLLLNRGRGGRRRQNLSVEEEVQLLSIFLRYTRAGHPINVSAFKDAYERRIGHAVPKSTIYRLLCRHNCARFLPRRSQK